CSGRSRRRANGRPPSVGRRSGEWDWTTAPGPFPSALGDRHPGNARVEPEYPRSVARWQVEQLADREVDAVDRGPLPESGAEDEAQREVEGVAARDDAHRAGGSNLPDRVREVHGDERVTEEIHRDSVRVVADGERRQHRDVARLARDLRDLEHRAPLGVGDRQDTSLHRDPVRTYTQAEATVARQRRIL